MALVKISQPALDAFRQMRNLHSLEYCVFHLPAPGGALIATARSNNIALTSQPLFDAFVKSLPADQCGIAVYDFRFLTDTDAMMHKLVFILWSPNGATESEKEMYAAARPAIRRQMAGVAFEMLAHSQDELEFEDIRSLIGA